MLQWPKQMFNIYNLLYETFLLFN